MMKTQIDCVKTFIILNIDGGEIRKRRQTWGGGREGGCRRDKTVRCKFHTCFEVSQRTKVVNGLKRSDIYASPLLKQIECGKQLVYTITCMVKLSRLFFGFSHEWPALDDTKLQHRAIRSHKLGVLTKKVFQTTRGRQN